MPSMPVSTLPPPSKHRRRDPARQGDREGGEMITHFRLGLIAVACILVQAVLVADVIYRGSQS